MARYYSTHQYFLSRRSLYVVVWRVPDGVGGLAGIQHWLVSIQARAPNSPVIIVGTHYDTVAEVNITIFFLLIIVIMRTLHSMGFGFLHKCSPLAPVPIPSRSTPVYHDVLPRSAFAPHYFFMSNEISYMLNVYLRAQK